MTNLILMTLNLFDRFAWDSAYDGRVTIEHRFHLLLFDASLNMNIRQQQYCKCYPETSTSYYHPIGIQHLTNGLLLLHSNDTTMVLNWSYLTFHGYHNLFWNRLQAFCFGFCDFFNLFCKRRYNNVSRIYKTGDNRREKLCLNRNQPDCCSNSSTVTNWLFSSSFLNNSASSPANFWSYKKALTSKFSLKLR